MSTNSVSLLLFVLFPMHVFHLRNQYLKRNRISNMHYRLLMITEAKLLGQVIISQARDD